MYHQQITIMLKLFTFIVFVMFATIYCKDVNVLDYNELRNIQHFFMSTTNELAFHRGDKFEERNSDFTCFDNEDCGDQDQGTCNNITQTCECTDEYASEDCDYKRKSQKLAFILELLCGFFQVKGVGYLYLGHIALGIILMILNFIGIGILFIPIIGWTTGIIVLFGTKIWWIILWAYILTDKINDGNGYSLYQDL